MYYTSRGTIWTGVALSLGYVSKTGDLLGGGVSIPPFIDNVLFIFCVHLSFVHRHMCRHYIEVKENGGVKKSSIFNYYFPFVSFRLNNSGSFCFSSAISCWNIEWTINTICSNRIIYIYRHQFSSNKNKNTVSRKSINRFLRLCPFLPNNNGGHNNNAGLFVNSC